MQCDEIREQMNDYVDGDLPEAAARGVYEHLRSCAACQRREQGLRQLLARAAALPRRQPPRRDLWPGIEARIAEGTRHRRGPRFRSPASRRKLGWAAAVAATVAAVVVSGILLLPGPPETRDAESASGVALPGEMQLARSGGAAHPGDEIQQARLELRRAVEARKASLSPATVEVLERNLRLIDQAISEIETALAEDPANPTLQQMLRASQRREIALLRTAAFLPQDT